MTQILVVEDEEHLATILRFNLEAEGYQVATEADTLTSNGGASVTLNTLNAPNVSASISGNSTFSAAVSLGTR